MGTAEFAVPALQSLFEHGYPIQAVITQPDKPAGRGQRIVAPPVKRKALELQLPVYQPQSLKTDDARRLFEALSPEMLIVVAYGKILPGWLIQLPRYGAINLHGSLLPRYRGAAPIQWAIANGDTETGVCTMQIDEGLDTGPVYLCERTPLGIDEGFPEVSARLAAMGSGVLERTVAGVVSGTLSPVPQDHAAATIAPVLRKEDGYLDWNLPALAIHNRIRAFNPWPGTVTGFRGAVCRILKSKITEEAAQTGDPGTIVATKRALAVVCGDGVLLEVLEIQAPNRKPVSGRDFANGMRLSPAEKFERLADNSR